MKRVRVAGIIFFKDGVALMHRKGVKKAKTYQEYYTFPGGGLEENETPEEGTIREIEEEFGIKIKVVKKLYETESKEFNQTELYYLCEYVSGEFGTGDGPEFHYDPKYVDSGEFLPEIVPFDKVEEILLLPPDVRDLFVKDLKEGKFGI